MASKITEDFIRRGLRGVALASNGEVLYESDIDILVKNIMSILPSTDIRFEFLKSTIIDKIPDKGNWDNFMILYHTDKLKYSLERKDNKSFTEHLHHVFLLSGYILYTQGSKTDDLLHNMISYYEDYKIPKEGLSYEVQNIIFDNAICTQIDHNNYIRTAKAIYWNQTVLAPTTKQQTLTKQIQNNGL